MNPWTARLLLDCHRGPDSLVVRLAVHPRGLHTHVALTEAETVERIEASLTRPAGHVTADIPSPALCDCPEGNADPMPADLPDRTLARMAEDEPCSSVTCGATGDDLDGDGRCSRCPAEYNAEAMTRTKLEGDG